MFEVKVTVELPGIPEAINNLADALRGKAPAKKAAKNADVAIANNGSGMAVGKLEGGMVINQGKAEQKKEEPEPSFIGNVPPDEPEIPAVEQPEQAPPLVNVPDTPVAPAAPVEQPVAAPVAPAPAPAQKYTFKQISKAGAALCTDMGKMDQLVALLNTKYGVPAITMINESRYGELAEDLIALGATIEEE